MKENNNVVLRDVFLAAVCLAINLGGKYIASALSLPIWLDSLGTMLAAYCFGPVSGAVIGFLTNMVWCFSDPMQWIYGLVSVAIGILIGLYSRYGTFKDISRSLNAGVVLAVASTLISVPLNYLFYDGSVGNIWGDGVIGFLQDQGAAKIVCCIVGEFYVDFVDKMLVCVLLFVILKFRDRISWHPLRRTTAIVLALALLVPFFGNAIDARADEETEETPDYSSYIQTAYNSTNGIPCGKTNYIAQTEDGTLWIGCYDGLYSYDGSDFTWKNEYESVKNVNCLYVDDQGRLLIGTNDDGLSFCIDDTITNVFDSGNGCPTDTIRSITQASDGYYYVGTSDTMMVMRYDNDTPEIVGVLSEVTSAIKGGTNASDNNGHAAAVTAMGDLFLLSGGEVVDCIPQTEDVSFMSAAFDENGLLFAGTTTNKVLVYDISSGTAELVKTLTAGDSISVDGIFPKSNNIIFLCTDTGVGFFDGDDVYHEINTNSFNNSFESMIIDYQGNLWFSSSRFGLLRLAPSSFTDLYSEIGMDSAVINTNCIWQGNLYVGTDNGLDIVSADRTREISNSLTEELAGTRIRCIITDSDNCLWICTYGKGLMCVDEQGKITTYNSDNGFLGNRVRLVTQLSDGTMAAASSDGLTFIKDGKIIAVTSYEDGFESTPVLTLTELSDGTILAGTDGAGLIEIRDYKAYRTLKKPDGLTSTVILRIVEDRFGDGAFLVTSNGISHISSSLEVRSLENFPYSNNYDLIQTEDRKVFVPSSAGIYVLDYDELLADEEDLAYELLDSTRGLTTSLTSNSWNCVDSDNNLYLSTGTGTFVVNLDDYHSEVTAYRMKIRAAELDGVSVAVTAGEDLSVDRTVKSITLYPQIFNFSVEDPSVSYYLEGFETSVHVAEQSALDAVTYTNLNPGTYVFHLNVLDDKAENSIGEITCTIVIEKAIQDNLWFILYLILVLIGFVAWLTWMLVHGRMDRKLALARQQVEMGNETIMAIAHTVDAKDSNTAHHSVRVSEYSVLIGRRLGMSEDECENLRKAALLHDIGKIAIPDSVLNKPARLTDEEYAIMKSHVDHGAEILKDFTLVEHASEGAQYHHERYDGRGYSHGLKGEEIPLYARIIGIADAFDAMTANRVYRKKMDFDYVLGELRKGRGTQFDPKLLDIFLSLIEEKVIDVEALYQAPAEAETAKTEAEKSGTETK